MKPMSGEGLDIDLAAGELRADARDTPALLNALAVWFETSLPHMAVVERKRAGLFDSRKLVTRITCRVGSETYVLEREGEEAVARRAKTVRGVMLKNETLALAEWIRLLSVALSEQAQLSGSAMGALRAIVT